MGAWRVSREALLQGPAVRVALVQGNVRRDRMGPAYRDEILSRYLALTRDAARQHVDLVIWPESSTPFVFGRDGLQTEIMRAAVQQAGVPVVFGSDEVVGPKEFYNAAFVMDARGEIRGSYRKMQLVPFGEYIPVRWLLFFAAAAGRRILRLQRRPAADPAARRGSQVVGGGLLRGGVPWLSRTAVRQGSQLLATITNDAWYGTSAAPYQHFQQARVRAVETGRYLVRAANTGISSVVDPYGRVQVQSPLFETGTWTGDVRWLDGVTWYVRIGDAVAWACMLVTMALLGLPVWNGSTGGAPSAVMRMREGRNVDIESSDGLPSNEERVAGSRASSTSALRHFVRGQRGRVRRELSGGVTVAFVKEEAYKRFEDLQRRAVELGRYL